jgi:hypothetical protein
MKTIYKILDPNNGSYETGNTEEEANTKAKEIAWNFYVSQTHGKPISKVTITDEGYEVWTGTDE